MFESQITFPQDKPIRPIIKKQIPARSSRTPAGVNLGGDRPKPETLTKLAAQTHPCPGIKPGFFHGRRGSNRTF